MRTLTRHILFEFLQPLAYCVVTFSSLFVILQSFNFFSEIMENKPPVGAVLLFFAVTLAQFVKFIFPASLMLATLYTVWRLCRNSEISAMRASGVSFFTISMPILATALVFTLLVFLNTEFFVPRFADNAKNMIKPAPKTADAKEGASYFNANHRRKWRIGRFDPAAPDVLRDITITFERKDITPELVVTAPVARWLDGVWWLENPLESHYNELGDSIPSPAPLLNRLSIRAFPQLNETPEDFRDRLWEYRSFMSRRRYIQMNPHLYEPWRTYDMLDSLAVPWACLVMTLFAIPAGLATGRQSVAKGVIAAIAAFFTFFALTIFCALLTRLPPHSPWHLSPWIAAWAPNLLFLSGGFFLFYRQR